MSFAEVHTIDDSIGLGENRNDMIIPEVERLPLLGLPVMPLIDTGDPGARPADMIQHRFGDFKANAQPLKSGSERSAKIMQPPGSNRIAAILGNHSIKLFLPFVITSKPTAS